MARDAATGVDDAICLLLALAASDWHLRNSDLSQRTGIARSSLHRIARTLTAVGLTNRSRGEIRIGPLAGTILAAQTRDLHLLARRDLGEPGLGRAHQLGRAADTGVIALSAPLVVRNRGRVRIGFSNASSANPWRTALVHAVERGARALRDSVNWLAVRHAADDADRQCRQIEALMQEGVDGLIVSAASAPEVTEKLADCISRGVAVVLVDRDTASPIACTSIVTGCDIAIGHTTALWLAETLTATRADRTGNKPAHRKRILMLPGRADAEPARIRLAAAQAVFAAHPALVVNGPEWTDWSAATAYGIVAAHLARDCLAFDGVWCDSGLQGAGSLQAFLAAGTQPVPPHTGGDLNLVYKLALRHGVPLAAIDYPPVMGRIAVETLHAALRGRWVPRQIEVWSDVILTRGSATRSVHSTLLAEDHVRWDRSDDLILHAGLGKAYDPQSFRIRYPGNSYNRSAAQLARAAPQ